MMRWNIALIFNTMEVLIDTFVYHKSEYSSIVTQLKLSLYVIGNFLPLYTMKKCKKIKYTHVLNKKYLYAVNVSLSKICNLGLWNEDIEYLYRRTCLSLYHMTKYMNHLIVFETTDKPILHIKVQSFLTKVDEFLEGTVRTCKRNGESLLLGKQDRVKLNPRDSQSYICWLFRRWEL